jgi:HK97 gp10 family phage protein
MVATFRVTNPEAPKIVADPGIHQIADNMQSEVTARTPVLTGQLAGAWQVTKHGESEYRLSNPTPYARYVEYGTRYDTAQPMIGPVVAQHRGSG